MSTKCWPLQGATKTLSDSTGLLVRLVRLVLFYHRLPDGQAMFGPAQQIFSVKFSAKNIVHKFLNCVFRT